MGYQRICWVIETGEVSYQEALHLQQVLFERRGRGEIPDILLLMNHPHTYTLGRQGKLSHLLVDIERLEEVGIGLHWVDRGGGITYHGPGQLVGYPLLDLGSAADIHRYLRNLEEVILRTVSSLGVQSQRKPGFTGVWVGDKKVAAIGIKVTRGLTKHGFALNVSPDLSYFSKIIPCGLPDKGVTSLSVILQRLVRVEEVIPPLRYYFGQVFGLALENRPLENLGKMRVGVENSEPCVLSEV